MHYCRAVSPAVQLPNSGASAFRSPSCYNNVARSSQPLWYCHRTHFVYLAAEMVVAGAARRPAVTVLCATRVDARFGIGAVYLYALLGPLLNEAIFENKRVEPARSERLERIGRRRDNRLAPKIEGRIEQYGIACAFTKLFQ